MMFFIRLFRRYCACTAFWGGTVMYLDYHSKAIFNSFREGILIINTEEKIEFANTAYLDFLKNEANLEPGDVIGQKLRDIRPGARLPEVLKRGHALLQEARRESKDIYFVNMYPIYVGDELEGAISVVTFQADADAFRNQVENAEKRLQQKLRRVSKASAQYTFDSLIAESPVSKGIKKTAEMIAETDANILITSENGSGKEAYAQAIHNASSRAHGVFVAVNCATMNPDTLDSELFGYVEGAFSGAKAGGKVGLFEAASGGTLLLDEISEMNLFTQAKLLRVLKNKTVRPVGSYEEIPVDVRVIAACNVNLEEYLKEGKFRPDLYSYLSLFHIHIPPLRDRVEDIPAMVEQLLSDFSITQKREITISSAAMSRLLEHKWPGNSSELKNVLEFSAYLSPTGVIEENHLPENIGSRAERDTTLLYQRIKRFERNEILKALDFYGSDLKGKKMAAEELGISLASLYNKLNEDV